jgi:hypothetical protein
MGRFRGSAYLNEFVSNQWERKGTYTDFHWTGLYNMGPKADVLHSDVKDFFVIFVNSSFMCMAVFSSTHRSCRYQSNKMWQDKQCRLLNDNQTLKVLRLLLAELCWSVLGSMATRRLLTDRHYGTDTRLGLWCAFIRGRRCCSRVTVIPLLSQITQWTGSINCRPVAHVVHAFTGGLIGLR